MIDKTAVWMVMIPLALGTFALRFSFLGILGDRPFPPWLQRHLRYTAVAILPALIMPLVVWPTATGGMTEPARLTAGIVTLVVGYLTKQVLPAMIAGALILIVMQNVIL